ncbi:hypothetical protein [Methylobacterium pseudosasicola]|uniref:Uncharacterized protein n=1 Tax=Methylobacterium pseudosasicola TaxID=582667 RepID=A0A1I4RSR0_9HYPH|nr:hypothetical protein [Methylobacterium pseudosasicola]SFM55033.1 hypothetical protein SAMN05192568_103750 [Methylobacterium pseudosasicola]
MSKPISLTLAAALLLSVPAGATRADSTTGFSAANAALLRGYTASPAQLYVSSGSPGFGFVDGPAAAPQRPKAPIRAR